MKLIRELSECIDVNIRCAKKCRRLANDVRCKHQEIAETLFQINEQQIEIVNQLRYVVEQLISEHGELPREYENLYSYLREKYSDEINTIEPTE